MGEFYESTKNHCCSDGGGHVPVSTDRTEADD